MIHTPLLNPDYFIPKHIYISIAPKYQGYQPYRSFQPEERVFSVLTNIS